MSARIPWSVLALALIACGGSDKDVTDDTDIAVLDTFPSDTAEDTVDTRPTADPDDTGTYYVLDLDGQAQVAPRVRFRGWQTLTARWLKNLETRQRPKCIYAWDLTEWEGDADRNGTTNPILQEDFDSCTDCTFKFTVTLKNVRWVDRYPWHAETDPVDIAGVKESNRRKLSCSTLTEEQGFVTPEQIAEDPDSVYPEWQGIAFNPVIDNDGDDVNSGFLMAWLPRYATWSPYAYTATFDPFSGLFTWNEALPPYEYAP